MAVAGTGRRVSSDGAAATDDLKKTNFPKFRGRLKQEGQKRKGN